MRKISDSFTIKTVGKGYIDTISKINIENYRLDSPSIDFIVSLIERKVSNGYKNTVSKFLKNGNIILCNIHDQNIPPYLSIFPTIYNGKMVSVVNVNLIGTFDKIVPTKLVDIETRTVFSLSLFSLIQLLVLENQKSIFNNYSLQKNILGCYKKMFNKIADPILSVQLFPSNLYDTYEALLNYYILRVMFEKDPLDAVNQAVSNVKYKTEPSYLKRAIGEDSFERIKDFSSFIEVCGDLIGEFKQYKAIHFYKKWLEIYRLNSALTIDLLQYYIPMLIAVSAFSSNYFNDLTINKMLDKELEDLSSIMFKYI